MSLYALPASCMSITIALSQRPYLRLLLLLHFGASFHPVVVRWSSTLDLLRSPPSTVRYFFNVALGMFAQNLELSRKPHLFLDFNVHKIGMYFRVSGRPRVFKCAYLMCLRSRPISGNKEEHSRFGHAKGASVSTFSSHSQARADRFTKHLPFRKACTARIRAVTKFGNTVSHIGHTLEIVIVVTTSSFSPCVPLQNTACTSCATTALCDSKKSVHFLPRCVQHLHWFVLCVLSQALRRVLGAFLVA